MVGTHNFAIGRNGLSAGAAMSPVSERVFAMPTANKRKSGDDETVRSLQRRISRLEQELARHRRQEDEQERLAVVVRDSNDAITLLDLDGNITEWNCGAARMYGYSEAEALRMTIFQIAPQEQKDATLKFLDSIKRGETIDSFETQRLTKQGQLLDIWLTVTPVYDAKMKMMAIATTERDISDRKRLEEAFQEHVQTTKLFAYSVMHDLKSPLTAINGLAQRLQKNITEFPKEKIEQYCEQILRTTKTLLDLVEKVNIYFSEKETPRVIENVSLAEIMMIIRDEFSGRLEKRAVKLTEQKKLPEINADRISLLRVLRNLVDNALNYGGDTLSEITISHRETCQFHIFTVHDNGVGFNQENSAKIFKPFQRSNKSHETCGAGLGLAIVKEIAKQHDGKVWTEHDAEHGVSFCFSVSKSLVL
jgi:PAS domain S-box-containing protein